MREDIRIGIMADSHGKPDTIAAAVNLFKIKECLYMYHLGDICDSGSPETVESCVSIIKSNNVQAVKGNNDHAISANHPKLISDETIAYLSALPLVALYSEAIFTHSLPFEGKLGLSCMIRGMGKTEAALFFKKHPDKILFRGHSHSPEIISKRNGEIIFRAVSSGENIKLDGGLPCIITCGSLAAGYCMIWNTGKKTVECVLIQGSGNSE
jgi:predicted phosphodiesterase